ncbi:MAG: DUF309 domain-containing protein [Planctomycetes bacterium]|nr:DUF309 domain-containing protein [Planctomycetota bacterium]
MVKTLSEPDATRFLKGLALLNAGEAFDAHEVWEELWLEAGGARARFLQGMIQLAVAMHHWQTGRHSAARRLLERGEAKLRTPETPGLTGLCNSAEALAWSTSLFTPLIAAKKTGEEPEAPPPAAWPPCGSDVMRN